MPTKNPRFNITFDPKTATILTQLAKKQDKPVASVAKDLILEALELQEDVALSSIAAIRDAKNSKKIKHDDAWK